MTEIYETEYEKLIEGLENRFGYGQEILDYLEDKCLLSFIIIEGKPPREPLVNYLD